MYTVKHMLSCHFSLSLSYSSCVSIHLSLPSHLLYHLCSCNKQDSSCTHFHSLAFSSHLILAHPPSPGMASLLPDCLTDLSVSHDRATIQSDLLFAKVAQTLVTHYVPAITQQAPSVDITMLSSFCERMAAGVNVITLHVLSLWHVQDAWSLSITSAKQSHLPLMAKTAQSCSW